MALEPIVTFVTEGRVKQIEGAVQSALESGRSPDEILSAMSRAMNRVGELFQKGDIFVAEMLTAAMTMKKGIGVLQPHMRAGQPAPCGKCIAGTVKGDLHDLGKNLVSLMLETVGFEVVDLGVDVSPERFLAALAENPDCRLVAVSALLTTTLDAMRRVVLALRGSGAPVKIMVGGAPVTEAFAAAIGADAFAPDARSAAVKALELGRPCGGKA